MTKLLISLTFFIASCASVPVKKSDNVVRPRYERNQVTKTNMQTFQDAALKVAMFWSDKMRTPMNQNNGDDSQNGGMAFLLMNMVASKAQETITDEKIKIFEETLISEITKLRDDGKDITLSVDYHPDKELSKACEASSISPSALPCKTVSWIDDNNVATAKYQYGGRVYTL